MNRLRQYGGVYEPQSQIHNSSAAHSSKRDLGGQGILAVYAQYLSKGH